MSLIGGFPAAPGGTWSSENQILISPRYSFRTQGVPGMQSFVVNCRRLTDSGSIVRERFFGVSPQTELGFAGLQIAMHDSFFVRRFQRIGNLMSRAYVMPRALGVLVQLAAMACYKGLPPTRNPRYNRIATRPVQRVLF
jgi:hypothetical protein